MAEVAVWIVSTLASTVTCSAWPPTSSARFTTGVSVTATVTLGTSTVLKPPAANRIL